MRRTAPVLAALVSAVLVSGCGQDTVTTDVAQPPGDDPAAVGPPVLQVEQVGGFLPVDEVFRSLPELTVYDDGRALVLGPQVAVFPGPALPNVQEHQLEDDAVAELVQLARDAGLLSEPPDYGSPPVADASTTVVTVDVAGERYQHEVYALGLGPGLPEEPAVTDGLPPEAQQARERVSGFLEEARALVEQSGPATPYVAEAFALRATAAPDGVEQPVEPEVRPWPLEGVDLAGAQPCVVVDGDAADALRTTLQDADALTRFTQDGTAYELAVRPLLPHQSGC